MIFEQFFFKCYLLQHFVFQASQSQFVIWLCLCVQGFEFSVFEVNIRFVGGLLACYALTGDLVWMVFTVHCNVMLCVVYCSSNYVSAPVAMYSSS